MQSLFGVFALDFRNKQMTTARYTCRIWRNSDMLDYLEGSSPEALKNPPLPRPENIDNEYVLSLNFRAETGVNVLEKKQQSSI